MLVTRREARCPSISRSCTRFAASAGAQISRKVRSRLLPTDSTLGLRLQVFGILSGIVCFKGSSSSFLSSITRDQFSTVVHVVHQNKRTREEV